MSIDSACNFVAKRRDDHSFRKRVLSTNGPEDLSEFLGTENLVFDQKELIEAMAKCMEQMELQMSG